MKCPRDLRNFVFLICDINNKCKFKTVVVSNLYKLYVVTLSVSLLVMGRTKFYNIHISS